MNTQRYNWILYLISTTIVITIAVQLYWNYNNYLDNKQRVQNEIQNSINVAIDEYYSDLSKDNFFAIFSADSIRAGKGLFGDWMPNRKDSSKSKFTISSIQIKTNDPDEYRQMPAILDSLIFNDSVITGHLNTDRILDESKRQSHLQIIRGEREADSLRLIRGVQSVVIALSNDAVDFDKLDSIFSNHLDKKGIDTDHYLALFERDSLVGRSDLGNSTLAMYANSKSTFLRPYQSLRVYYKDPTLAALKKSSTGILLSLLLSITVILSLFYLLRIIRKQKELAEIKNDLISNITHEFKTPIATVSTAIEAIENFNVLDDKEKTKKYLSMSSVQLKKLHQMVEKLLETATLDSEKLILKKEPVDLVDLVARITKKHEILTEKNISFSSNIDSKMQSIDLFHFENAISNLVDNAIKYGGENIELNVNSVLNTTVISIADDGHGIEKNQHERIFDKFYRVPKGNRHDVKGFGIGLYYTKKIIEKHGGTIGLTSQKGTTVFKINIPNE